LYHDRNEARLAIDLMDNNAGQGPLGNLNPEALEKRYSEDRARVLNHISGRRGILNATLGATMLGFAATAWAVLMSQCEVCESLRLWVSCLIGVVAPGAVLFSIIFSTCDYYPDKVRMLFGRRPLAKAVPDGPTT
jgi:hypothetical protein